jgi:hypothetical protein
MFAISVGLVYKLALGINASGTLVAMTLLV